MRKTNMPWSLKIDSRIYMHRTSSIYSHHTYIYDPLDSVYDLYLWYVGMHQVHIQCYCN